jgi:hypothetical protein
MIEIVEEKSLALNFCLIQDAFLHGKKSKSCLISIKLNSYFPPRLRLDFLGTGCRFQPAFDKISKVEGYQDSVSKKYMKIIPLLILPAISD